MHVYVFIKNIKYIRHRITQFHHYSYHGSKQKIFCKNRRTKCMRHILSMQQSVKSCIVTAAQTITRGWQVRLCIVTAAQAWQRGTFWQDGSRWRNEITPTKFAYATFFFHLKTTNFGRSLLKKCLLEKIFFFCMYTLSTIFLFHVETQFLKHF